MVAPCDHDFHLLGDHISVLGNEHVEFEKLSKSLILIHPISQGGQFFLVQSHSCCGKSIKTIKHTVLSGYNRYKVLFPLP